MVPTAASERRHVLPSDLPIAIKQLEDRELDQLLSAVLAEQKRRGKKRSVSAEGRRRERKVHASPLTLTRGQINAVRSAFKAGVTPSRIARQFGLSLSDVRKALASDPKR
jgi:DNA invertase Pin-like site-specific DNA recombinase